VGALGHRHRARVDHLGTVRPTSASFAVGWWIGADDRWRVPANEVAVRQTLLDDTPVVQTAMRVPGGDAVQRVYGAAGEGDPIVIEVENASPAPFVLAIVVSGLTAVSADGPSIVLDGRRLLVGARPPSRWSQARGRSTEVEVLSGQARSGAFPPIRDRGGRLEASFLHPVPHRTTLRFALLGRSGAVDVRSLPDASSVARGWLAQTERAMRVDLPDPALAARVRRALGDALLAATGSVPDADAVAALEDWGFDDEVAASWARMTWRGRRRAARRPTHPDGWRALLDRRDASGPDFLVVARGLLVRERADEVSLLADLPTAWRGAPIEVHDAPTRAGRVSYAIRWHGDRPALLWDSPGGVTLRAPALDPEWSTTDPSGEALFTSGSVEPERGDLPGA
jgi:hypothetical protein